VSSLPVPSHEDELGSLYERHAPRMFAYCLRRLPSREEAEDAVQQTFLNAYRGLQRGTTPRSETAWLYKIAENVCRERRRAAWRRRRVETVHDPDGIARAAAPESEHDELAGLADALSELAPNQQRAILLREWQGLSYREIATELGVTQAAVETLLFRARRSLATKLDRTRARAIANLGSAAAWGKSLLGGAAAKIAATAGVFIAVTAMTPALREQIQGALASPPPAKQSGVAEIALQPGALGLSAELQKPSSAGGARLAHPAGGKNSGLHVRAARHSRPPVGTDPPPPPGGVPPAPPPPPGLLPPPPPVGGGLPPVPPLPPAPPLPPVPPLPPPPPIVPPVPPPPIPLP